MDNKKIGYLGETAAKKFLISNGYRILAQNFRTRSGELDLIAEKNKTLVFFEIKTRTNLNKGQPYEAVNLRKLSHLKKAIYYYLLTNKIQNSKLRLDVLGVLLGDNGQTVKIKHYENVEPNNYKF